ncbi:MAG: N-acetyltransferase [Smithella sp.]
MIRDFEPLDMNDVLDIWLKASTQAHSFIESEFWKSKIDDMRKTYIPASDTYVFSDNGTVKGFISLHGDTVAAMFVSPNVQGQGIGQKLMDKAKSLRRKLNLAVYSENPKSIQFYRKGGFTIIRERIDQHTGHIEILMEYGS